jgi:hypothetical protein
LSITPEPGPRSSLRTVDAGRGPNPAPGAPVRLEALPRRGHRWSSCLQAIARRPLVHSLAAPAGFVRTVGEAAASHGSRRLLVRSRSARAICSRHRSAAAAASDAGHALAPPGRATAPTVSRVLRTWLDRPMSSRVAARSGGCCMSRLVPGPGRAPS